MLKEISLNNGLLIASEFESFITSQHRQCLLDFFDPINLIHIDELKKGLCIYTRETWKKHVIRLLIGSEDRTFLQHKLVSAVSHLFEQPCPSFIDDTIFERIPRSVYTKDDPCIIKGKDALRTFLSVFTNQENAKGLYSESSKFFPKISDNLYSRWPLSTFMFSPPPHLRHYMFLEDPFVVDVLNTFPEIIKIILIIRGISELHSIRGSSLSEAAVTSAYETIFSYASKYRNGGYLACLANVHAVYPDGVTPLIDAINACQVNIVQQLLDARANPDQRDPTHGNETALIRAINMSAIHKDLRIIDTLIASNANVNLSYKGGSGSEITPLYCAVDNSSMVVATLIAHGADMELCAFRQAAISNRVNTVALFIACGMNVNQVDYSGNAVIHDVMHTYAPTPARNYAIRKLLEAKADVNLANMRGETFLSLANRFSFHETLAQLLQQVFQQPTR